MKLVSLIFGLLLGTNAFAAHGPLRPLPATIDPQGYAEASAKDYSLGDDNKEGPFTCVTQTPAENPSIIIGCDGTRKVLVHGGRMFAVSFTCRFVFDPAGRNRNGHAVYSVSEEDCE